MTKKPIVLEKMLQAKARHDDRKVEEIERDQALLERAAKLEANNGMDHKPAIAIALKMQDLKDRANGKGSKIHGTADDTDPLGRLGLSRGKGPLSESRRLSNSHKHCRERHEDTPLREALGVYAVS